MSFLRQRRTGSPHTSGRIEDIDTIVKLNRCATLATHDVEFTIEKRRRAHACAPAVGQNRRQAGPLVASDVEFLHRVERTTTATTKRVHGSAVCASGHVIVWKNERGTVGPTELRRVKEATISNRSRLLIDETPKDDNFIADHGRRARARRPRHVGSGGPLIHTGIVNLHFSFRTTSQATQHVEFSAKRLH